MEERLQKILARAGFGSRRACEEFIRERRVAVNGQVAQIGQKADPDRDRITLDGKPVQAEQPHIYVALHKPRDVLSDEGDGTGRIQTARDLIELPGRLYPVGRLDLRSEGLLILTDDGELTHRLTHPRYEHSKEYEVLVEGHPDEKTLQQWRRGVFLEGSKTAPAEVSVMRREKDRTWLRVILREGRKRQIRRMGAMLGHPVHQLTRVRIGPVHLGNLKPGEWRHLTEQELRDLLEIAERGKRPKRKRQ
jgi:23S rRNA pseudouridine2605 synthase